MEYKDRIKAARKHAKLTQVELAKLVGIDQTSISDLERGKSQSSSFNARIAAACGVNPLWLEDDVGDMVFKPDYDEIADQVERASGIRSLDAKEIRALNRTSSAADLVREMLATKAGKALSQIAQDRLLAAADESVLPVDKPGNVITADFSRQGKVGDEFRIAHYDVRAALGGGQVVPDYPEMMPDLLVSRRHLQELGVTYSEESHLKMLTGYGQSMAPTIQHLDPMIVDVSIRDFQGDGIYAFSWHGHFYVKRLQVADADHFEMISDNPHHKDREIRIDETYIQARVLLIWNAKKG
ncbi:transcriptional regulator, y4mF family [compost metagenome]